jgi:hypothetical protein
MLGGEAHKAENVRFATIWDSTGDFPWDPPKTPSHIFDNDVKIGIFSNKPSEKVLALT